MASGPTAINDRVITDEVLGVWQGHCKDVRRIIKCKKKEPDTSYSIVATGSKQSQFAEDQHRLAKRVDAQQRDNEALHHKINSLKSFITQTLSHAPPLPLPPPPPCFDDAEDLRRD